MHAQLLLLTLSILTLASAGCGGDGPDDPVAAEVVAVEVHGTHTVRCGCIIKSIGHCGNYVDVAGEPLPLTGDIGLGSMEFCGQGPLQAVVEGTVVDGAVVAISFALQE